MVDNQNDLGNTIELSSGLENRSKGFNFVESVRDITGLFSKLGQLFFESSAQTNTSAPTDYIHMIQKSAFAKSGIMMGLEGYPATLKSTIAEPYNVSVGDTLILEMNGFTKTITFVNDATFPLNSGYATADEISLQILNQWNFIDPYGANNSSNRIAAEFWMYAYPETNQTGFSWPSDEMYFVLGTARFGSSNYLKVVGGTAVTALGFTVNQTGFGIDGTVELKNKKKVIPIGWITGHVGANNLKSNQKHHHVFGVETVGADLRTLDSNYQMEFGRDFGLFKLTSMFIAMYNGAIKLCGDLNFDKYINWAIDDSGRPWADYLRIGAHRISNFKPTNVATTNTSRSVVFTYAAHGLSIGDIVEFRNSKSFSGIPESEVNRKLVVTAVPSADTFTVQVPTTPANATASSATLAGTNIAFSTSNANSFSGDLRIGYAGFPQIGVAAQAFVNAIIVRRLSGAIRLDGMLQVKARTTTITNNTTAASLDTNPVNGNTLFVQGTGTIARLGYADITNGTRITLVLKDAHTVIDKDDGVLGPISASNQYKPIRLKSKLSYVQAAGRIASADFVYYTGTSITEIEGFWIQTTDWLVITT